MIKGSCNPEQLTLTVGELPFGYGRVTGPRPVFSLGVLQWQVLIGRTEPQRILFANRWCPNPNWLYNN